MEKRWLLVSDLNTYLSLHMKPLCSWTDRMKVPLWKSWPRHDALVTHIRAVGMTSDPQRNIVVKQLHIRPEPFAEGAMRYAFPAADQEGRRFVLKVPCCTIDGFVVFSSALFDGSSQNSAAWSGGMEWGIDSEFISFWTFLPWVLFKPALCIGAQVQSKCGQGELVRCGDTSLCQVLCWRICSTLSGGTNPVRGDLASGIISRCHDALCYVGAVRRGDLWEVHQQLWVHCGWRSTCGGFLTFFILPFRSGPLNEVCAVWYMLSPSVFHSFKQSFRSSPRRTDDSHRFARLPVFNLDRSPDPLHQAGFLWPRKFGKRRDGPVFPGTQLQLDLCQVEVETAPDAVATGRHYVNWIWDFHDLFGALFAWTSDLWVVWSVVQAAWARVSRGDEQVSGRIYQNWMGMGHFQVMPNVNQAFFFLRYFFAMRHETAE